MPRLVLMTWVPSQRRWTKRYKGTRYYVSTKELGTPPTQADSLQAANEYWRNKQAEIDGYSRRPPPAARQPWVPCWKHGRGSPSRLRSKPPPPFWT
jgi:hypothetical protein